MESSSLDIRPEKRWGKRLWLLALPILFFTAFALQGLRFSGPYMDAVNPDYLAAWLMRGSTDIPAWIYRDNILAGDYRFPLLNSLYGGNPSAYAALVFFSIAGFGIGKVWIFHAILGIALLAALAWCLRQWDISPLGATACLCLLALDPSFVAAWRTQYYLQLVPFIFLAIGLGLLGTCCEEKRPLASVRRHAFLAGIAIGFAAFGYFIFAFYAAAILVYAYSIRKTFPLHRSRFPLLVGMAIGWLPFLYAHLSIIAGSSLHSYLEQLHQLQTAYGVVDQNQGGLLARIAIVLQRFDKLLAGNAIQHMIFGSWNGSLLSKIAAALVLGTGPVLLLARVFLNRRHGGDVPKNQDRNRLLAGILFSLVIAHCGVGLLIGRPLDLQHYIMLLPVLYLMLGVGCSALFGAKSLRAGIGGIAKTVLAAWLVLGFAFNLMLTQDYMSRLKQTGGSGMYSDAINVAAAQLQTLPNDTILLFPQWGYWMGIVTALGPRFPMYETATLAQMKNRMESEPKLRSAGKFMLVLNGSNHDGDKASPQQQLEDFIKSENLQVQDVKRCHGSDGVDEIWLALLQRSPEQ